MKTKEFSLRARMLSLRFAWQGIIHFFRREHNAWIHLLATIIVFVATWYYQLSNIEMIVVIIVTGSVWTAEVFNTAMERLIDFIHPERHDAIKPIKDLSAAAVLLSSVAALITGAFIFIPKIF